MKKVQNRFTIILAHYNQMKYIETSISSVLRQDYKDIELIITDDNSSFFDKKEIENFVEKNKHDNLKSFQIIVNSKNMGTVKTLNKALDYVTGEFVLFFAADDELNNKKVVSNFIKAFDDEKKNVITSQSLMYDETLTRCRCKYVNPQKAKKNNLLSAKEQYEIISKNCIYSSGSTAYRMSIFDKYGKFSEKYKLVEDWAYWVYITRCGEKLYYHDFNALNHREGGVSHNNYTPKNIPTHIIAYYIDILEIYSNEVIKYIDQFDEKNQIAIFERFKEHINYYGDYIGDKREKYEKIVEDIISGTSQFAKKYNKMKKKLRLKSLIRVHIFEKFRYYFISNKINTIMVILWLISSLIVTFLKLFDGNNLYYYYILSYIIINYIFKYFEKGYVLYLVSLFLTFVISFLLLNNNIISNMYIIIFGLPILFLFIYYIIFIPTAEIRRMIKLKKRKKMISR